MRTQTLLTAAASATLLGAIALLGATSPSPAAPARGLPGLASSSASSRANGGCGAASVTRPNFFLSSREGQAPVIASASVRHCGARTPTART
jgi:hypothetical protein